MGDTTQKETKETAIARKLEDARVMMARLHGELWPPMVAEWRPQIELLMKLFGTDNPIKAVLAVVDGGPETLFLLAVAAEMCESGKVGA